MGLAHGVGSWGWLMGLAHGVGSWGWLMGLAYGVGTTLCVTEYFLI